MRVLECEVRFVDDRGPEEVVNAGETFFEPSGALHIGTAPHMAITLTPDARKHPLASIRRYVSENLDQDAGDLRRRLLPDFVLKDIGPSIYTFRYRLETRDTPRRR